MAGPDAQERKANRIIKILKQISENLTQDEIISIRTNIQSAIDLSRNLDENTIKTFLMSHIRLIQFRPGISVNLVKQSIRSLLLIIRDESLGKVVYQMFTDYILREHSSVTIGMELDDELLKAYFKALEKGSEDAHHIRLMVVGMYEVGKTTLINKLLRKPDAEEPPPSTVVIDISFDACEVDEDGKWVTTEFADREKRYDARLQKLIRSSETNNMDTSVIDARDADPIDQDMDTQETIEFQERPTTHTENTSRFKLEVQKASEEEVLEPIQYYNDLEKADKSTRQQTDIEKRTTVSIWDFAGQSIYYSTHHFFLNPRAIYLLVLDLSKDLNENVVEGKDTLGATNLNIGNSATAHFTQLDAFQFWMRSIYIYTKQKASSISTDEYTPTIVLVGTKKDLRTFESEEKAGEYANKYFDKALEPFKGTPIGDLVYEKRFFVSKKESHDIFDSLRKELYHVATNQPFWKEQLPGKFIPLEREVDKKKNEKQDIIEFEKLEAVSKESHYPLEKGETQVFLKFQHAFGNVLYYKEANPDVVILKPQWIIDAFKLFVNHKGDSQSEEWKTFETMAKLSDNLINEIMQGEDAKWVPFKDRIIRYMEYLDIIAKPVQFEEGARQGNVEAEEGAVERTSQATFQQSVSQDQMWHVSINAEGLRTNEEFYMMPCKLPTRPSAEEIREILQLNGKSSPVLGMFIKGAFLPPFIFHRIIATCIKKMPVLVHDDKYVLYNGLGVFKIDETTLLTTWSWDNMIYFKVTSHHRNKDRRMQNADLEDVRTYFESLVMRLLNTDGSGCRENIEISYYVTCPECPEQFPFDRKTDKEGFPIDQKCGLQLVENLRVVKETMCNQNRHHITLHESLAKWFRDDTGRTTDARLSGPYDEKFLADLAEEIEQEKEHRLAGKLNITDKELQRIKEQFKTFPLDVTFHILYEWMKMHESLAILLPAAKEAGCKEEDFYRILDGRENERNTRKLAHFKQKLCPEKLANIELDGRACETIADHIGLQYRMLGIRLGIMEAEIQRMYNGKDDVKDIFKSMLLKWESHVCGSKTNKELNEELVKAMVKSRCDMRGVIKVFGRI